MCKYTNVIIVLGQLIHDPCYQEKIKKTISNQIHDWHNLRQTFPLDTLLHIIPYLTWLVTCCYCNLASYSYLSNCLNRVNSKSSSSKGFLKIFSFPKSCFWPPCRGHAAWWGIFKNPSTLASRAGATWQIPSCQAAALAQAVTAFWQLLCFRQLVAF